MTIQQILPAPQKGWFPLILITLLTLAIFIVSIVSLLSGWLTIFQNLFYFPIILACVYYVKRGFVFSVLLACGYFVLMAIFSQDPVVLEGALIRVLIFILVAGVITYLSMIRIRAEEALKESEAFNRGLVENMPNLVVVYDLDRKIRYVNPAVTALLGYSVEEVVGTDIMTYVDPHQHAEIATAIQERFSSYREKSLEIDLIAKGGEHLTVISKGAFLYFHNQPAILVLLADITDRKRAEDAALRVNQKLNILSQLTRQDLTNQIFVLNSYLGLAKLQLAGQDRLIEIVQKGEQAIRLIHEIVEYSKDYQDMGAKPPKWQNVKMAMLFGLSHISIGKIQHSLETENLKIFADPLLEKLCQRLFENSVTHGNRVTRIRVWHTVTPDGVTIFFEDDGIGIPQEKKDQIFLRGEGTRISMRSLIFVREILDITGITIHETGEPGRGARFEIAVPKGGYRLADVQ
jgi:PAS domain S-box-containing protein